MSYTQGGTAVTLERPRGHDQPTVYLVTCAEQASLGADDQFLEQTMRDAGIDVRIVVWTDPTVDWSKAAVCMVRSVWDYHLQPDRFRRWIATASAVSTLINPPALLTWNMHKRYLRQLAAQGVPTIDTVWISPGNSMSLAYILNRRGWDEALVKPAISASAWNTAKVRAGDVAGETLMNDILRSTDVMVQPYLTNIERDGEVAVIAIGGEVTHAARRMSPLTGDIQVTRQGAGHMVADDEHQLATHVLSMLPIVPEYARIDIVRDEQNRLLLGELELIEPVLYLRHSPAAAEQLTKIVHSYLTDTQARHEIRDAPRRSVAGHSFGGN